MASASSGFQPAPNWQWPESIPGQWSDEAEEELRQRQHSQTSGERPETSPPPRPSHEPPPGTKHYRSRRCRVCLDEVLPTYYPPTEGLPGIFNSNPSVTYESPIGDGGRLISPCKCKGSSRWVHEECLQAWRMANPLEKRNYWACPTCGYRYRLQRLSWARWIGSTTAQITLTIAIFIAAIFVLGFVADPIIGLYLSPYESIFGGGLLEDLGHTGYPAALEDDEISPWTLHWAKGLASLGLLSFAKMFLLSPRRWFFRTGTIGGGRGTGRDRLADISWLVVVIGAATFVWGVWQGVRSWSRRTLLKAGERVMDVPAADNDDDDD